MIFQVSLCKHPSCSTLSTQLHEESGRPMCAKRCGHIVVYACLGEAALQSPTSSHQRPLVELLDSTYSEGPFVQEDFLWAYFFFVCNDPAHWAGCWPCAWPPKNLYEKVASILAKVSTFVSSFKNLLQELASFLGCNQKKAFFLAFFQNHSVPPLESLLQEEGSQLRPVSQLHSKLNQSPLFHHSSLCHQLIGALMLAPQLL